MKPRERSWPAAAPAACPFRSRTTTLARASPIAEAIAKPMPCAAPVTTATFLSSATLSSTITVYSSLRNGSAEPSPQGVWPPSGYTSPQIDTFIPMASMAAALAQRAVRAPAASGA